MPLPLVAGPGSRHYATPQASAFFTEGFETGDLSHIENNARFYAPNGSVSVVTGNARTGTYSARIRYTTVVSDSEMPFTVGAVYSEVWIRFYLKFPSNYVKGSGNDKFFRLGVGTAASGPLLVGAQLHASDAGYVAKLSADIFEEVYADNELEMFETDRGLVSADLDTWREFVIYRRGNTIPVAGRSRVGGNGALKLYKDGACLYAFDEIADQYDGLTDFGTTWGYLMGGANGGFSETTDIYNDDVEFATSNKFGIVEHYRWGYTQATTGSGDSASAAFCIGATGVTPDRSGMTLKSIRSYCANATGRIAVYTGGTSSSANGATLLVDGGADTADILQADVDIALPQNTRIWIVIKLGSGVMGRQISVSGFGGTSFDGVRTLTTELGTTTATAFPASISGAGTAATWIPAAWIYHT